MRVTSKGQVTIPQALRERHGILPYTEVEFVEENGRIYLVKKEGPGLPPDRFDRLRGAATVKMSTEDILRLTRGEDE
jgi:AbrB family looped-hinge helix DNA binding protein